MKRKHSILNYNFLVLLLFTWVICCTTGSEDEFEYKEYDDYDSINDIIDEEYDGQTDSYDEEYDEDATTDDENDSEYDEETTTHGLEAIAHSEKTTSYDEAATVYDEETTTKTSSKTLNKEDNHESNYTDNYIEGVTTARDIYTTDLPSLNYSYVLEYSKNHQDGGDQTTEAQPVLQTTTTFTQSFHINNNKKCHNYQFGCCPDGYNPAHGPEYYGCCASSEYGCCPGNMDTASGPYDDGCDSSNSKYGLCPDGITIAIGEDLLGCGCRYMPNGCCPDRSTPAKGPGYEGCDCSTFEYGCCPDGESIAQGRHFEGCKSCNSDWGCCPDGITPKGASESCDECQNTKYGCCFDGNTTALGLHFEGCGSNLLEELPKKCSSKSRIGSCSDFQIKWFYDATWGGCNKFWYGGCDPGENHFDTEEECIGICVNPRGSQVCYLDMNTGSCDATYNEFYYDYKRGSCVPFVYGGCLGNGNRNGLGDFNRWYYDYEEGKCKNFSYSGCGGNNNRFLSEVECLNTCRKDTKERLSKTVCRSSYQITPSIKDGGTIFPAWTYDSLVRRCIPLYASSAEMEQDILFSTWEECSNICPTTYPPVISFLRGPEILVERQSLAPIIAPISIKSNPPANIQWFKNGQLIDVHHDFRYILGDDFSLKLRGRATDFDGGKYVVKADNGIGSPSTAEIEVVIYPLYSFVSINVEKNQFLSQELMSSFLVSHSGDSGTYKCEAESPMSPTASEGIKISVQYGPGEKCVDRPSYRHCHQVIKHKFCGNKYYAQYCCRSCMEAGFLPAEL
ncbi:PAPLN [Lepeophtheirus salmonis]|uniref:PAPLN n=1 Tax=Lepeophtheirus salmonis TaxID=72036 RepID=A0A7R8CJ78_LEPSM|nr:PAPLN [Lepeophtheirus salmonis]CAF2808236.1 PAPLN [Lepeophtheirus salmonis]